MKKKIIIAVAIAALIIVVAEIVLNWEPIIHATGRFFSPENIEHLLEQAGPWGPLLLIALQILQVVLAPVPGPVVGIAGGYVFGALWGTVYSLIGLTIGSFIAIWLTRVFGRRFAERFIKPEKLAKFDHIAEKGGLLIFFLVFLLPFLPDDAICFVAGLTKLPIAALVLIAFLGRLPGMFFANVWGQSFREDNGLLILVTISLTVIFLAMLFIFRSQIKQIFTRHKHKAAAPEPPAGKVEAGE